MKPPGDDARARSRERLFATIAEVQKRNADVPFEEIERDVTAAIREVRAAKRRSVATDEEQTAG